MLHISCLTTVHEGSSRMWLSLISPAGQPARVTAGLDWIHHSWTKGDPLLFNTPPLLQAHMGSRAFSEEGVACRMGPMHSHTGTVSEETEGWGHDTSDTLMMKMAFSHTHHCGIQSSLLELHFLSYWFILYSSKEIKIFKLLKLETYFKFTLRQKSYIFCEAENLIAVNFRLPTGGNISSY